jgi:hypothetical protein
VSNPIQVKTSADFAARFPKYWTVNYGNNLRRYFEEFAKTKNHDPLLPNTWYSMAGKFYSMQKVPTAISEFKFITIRTKLRLFLIEEATKKR